MGNIINWQKLIPAVMLAAGVLVSVNAAAAPQSEQEPLAQLQLDVDGDGTQETVELYGGWQQLPARFFIAVKKQ